MANHAHSTRTPLLPEAGTPSALLPRGAGRQPGPVTLALRAMRTADPDQAANDAIEAICQGLDRHFSEADRRRLAALRQSVADRIERDVALLDALDGDQDLEADYGTQEFGPSGSIVISGRSTDDEDGDNGCGDLDGLLEQHGHGAFGDAVFG